MPESPTLNEDAPRCGSLGRRWAAGAFAVLIVLAGVVLQARLRAGATPKITWSQPNVLEFLQPNQIRTVTVTFQSDQGLTDVAVFVAPALSSVLSVSPARIASVSPNHGYQLALALKAGVQSELKFDGTIQIKSGVLPKATLAPPLPVTVVIHDTLVPPDPGPTNNQTIAGIDADGDGVRDDVQRFIIAANATSPENQDALLQYARTVQRELISSDVLSAIDDEAGANLCIAGVFGPSAANRRIGELRAKILNTSSRLNQWALRVNDKPPSVPPVKSADLKSYCVASS